MKALKIVGAVFAGVVVLAVLLLAVSWLGTSGPRAQAAAVIAAARAGDAEALAPLLHPSIQAEAPPDKVLHMLRGWGLHEPGELRWRKWDVGTDGATLQGVIDRGDGGSQPLTVAFRRHDGDWKLVSIDTELQGLVRDPLALQVPPRDELVAMLAQVARDFGAGVREGSLTRLHTSMSRNARARFTRQELDAAFGQFITQGIEVDRAAELEPLLHPPAMIDPNGILRASGHYPSSPVLRFTYGFAFEEGGWRLAHLKLDLGAPDPD